MATLVRVEVKGNVVWQCGQVGDNWIGVCDPLKLTVQSETWASLMEDIGLALNAILLDLHSSNELTQFLRDRGWNLSRPIPTPQEDVRFDVPFIPAMMGANGSQRELHQ